MSEKYKNNIIIYYDRNKEKWITEEEYNEILKKNILDKRLKDIIPITKDSAYYVFFKDKIDKITSKQLKIKEI